MRGSQPPRPRQVQALLARPREQRLRAAGQQPPCFAETGRGRGTRRSSTPGSGGRMRGTDGYTPGSGSDRRRAPGAAAACGHGLPPPAAAASRWRRPAAMASASSADMLNPEPVIGVGTSAASPTRARRPLTSRLGRYSVIGVPMTARRSRPRGRPARRAAGLARAGRPPVRLLPARPAHDRSRAPELQPCADRHGHRRHRERVPMRHVRPDPAGHQARGATDARPGAWPLNHVGRWVITRGGHLNTLGSKPQLAWRQQAATRSARRRLELSRHAGSTRLTYSRRVAAYALDSSSTTIPRPSPESSIFTIDRFWPYGLREASNG